MITTGAIMTEYSTDGSGAVVSRRTPQTAISDGSSFTWNIGIKYYLKKK